MPLTPHGRRMLRRLRKRYSAATAQRILYASRNAGKKGFQGIDRARKKKK